MLINLSNHQSCNWQAEQTKAACEQFGEIVDLPFPNVNPEGDETYIQMLAEEYFRKILTVKNTKNTQHAHNKNNDHCEMPCEKITVHIMGEMTFTFAMVNLLQHNGFTCISSTTERVAKETGDTKISEFRFKRFREYIMLKT